MSHWVALLAALFVLLPCRAEASPEVLDRNARGELHAGDEGAVVHLGDGSTLRLSAGARLAIGHTGVWFPGRGMVQSDVVELRYGGLSVELLSLEGEARVPVLVRTWNQMTVATLGGRLEVHYEGGAAAVNSEGAAYFRTGPNWKQLPKGKRVTQAEGELVPALGDALPAPALRARQRLWVVQGRDLKVPADAVSWSPLHGASAYVVDVHRTDSTDQGIRAVVQQPNLGTLWSEARPGRYVVQVNGLDEFGLPGSVGSLEIAVVGMSTSSRHFAEFPGCGTPCVALEVRLTHVDGIQMQFGGTPGWFPALPSLLLPTPLHTQVLLKHPSDSRGVPLQLVSSRVGARVILRPNAASWPGSRVQAEVHLDDDVGGKRAATETVTIVATIGVTVLDLTWKRSASRLVADIPEQSGAGPWVLRVSVLNSEGAEIGRNFLEIVNASCKDGKCPPGCIHCPAQPGSPRPGK